MDLKQEKLEEMRQDLLVEQKMREDIYSAIENYNSYETLVYSFNGLYKHLDILGYEMTRDEVFQYLKELL